MTDQTIAPGSTDGAAPLGGPAAPRRTPRRRVAAGALTAGPYRIVTANVQSFPVNAISLAEALDDLRRNAADGDVVLLQEIAARYKTLVQMAFPAADWVVYYGRSDNSTPIAFRRALFAKVEGRVDLLHPAVRHLHFRRYMTYLRLRARDRRFEFHVTNLHMVAGAFNGVDEPDQALRLEEWNDGIARHRRFVEGLVETGLPVVGGGDYNRQLGIATYSPRLDRRGNSCRGIELCVELAARFGLHTFDCLNSGSSFLEVMLQDHTESNA